ncbi:efflux RND transporter periplasmic adaptor subunit [Pseudomonas sp. F1_0610]|uniref:HlyD family secretion protein n=1 Tax=Pseudomonas sp. F1_0610 TaxID=3114284 RepID=UPI0039C0BE44
MSKRVWITVLIIIMAISLAILFRANSHKILLQGEVDAPEVIVTSKAKGRVMQGHVQRGDDVQQGQLLITFDSPELLAQMAAREAARDKAKAVLDESIKGTREETIRSVQAQLAQAQAVLQDAENEFKRISTLSAQGYLSKSALDSARKARDTALQQVKAAQANVDMANTGDREEQRRAYEAAFRQAEQAVEEFAEQTNDLLLKAPITGEISALPAEEGMLMNAGTPLLSIIRLDQAYFVFNLREDILVGVRKGDTVSIRVPALKDQQIEAQVRYIAPLGAFATKRATRATGDFDLKTFEVHLYPLQPVEGLRPGMSALWPWED